MVISWTTAVVQQMRHAKAEGTINEGDEAKRVTVVNKPGYRDSCCHELHECDEGKACDHNNAVSV